MVATKAATAAVVSGIVAGAGLLATLVASPTLAAAPGGGCSATARIETQWGSGPTGGQIITVTVTNTSASTSTDWAVTWTLAAGQELRSAWNAVVRTEGATVTATNTAWNGRLATGASATFGMQLSGVAAAPVPSCDNGGVPEADVTVDRTADQSTVTLQIGQTLAVSLDAGFRPLTASGASLSPLSATGGYPTGRALAALYRASAAGVTHLTTSTPSGVLWTLHVSVAGTSPTGDGETHIVTKADNLGTVSMHAGDILVVSLPSNYVPPVVSPDGILSLAGISGGYPTPDPLNARYLAAAPGEADVTTLTDALCNHEPTPCPSPADHWRLHVIVT